MNFCKPENNEIEISLFGGGAGYGESLLIHYGNGKWALIDSAINPNTKNPIIEEYLHSIGLSYNDIFIIIATHWHDDHIKGLANIYNSCPNATFYCSDAFNSSEFFQLYAAYKDSTLPNNGIRALTEIITLIDQRDDYFRTLKVNKLMLQENINTSILTIHSLSPSDYSCWIAKQELISLMPLVGESITGVHDIQPNQNCIVLLMSFNDENILLAADIENTKDSRTGWNGILNHSNIFQGKKIKVYKVAHHGSEGAYNKQIWHDYLDRPISMLTPFAKGKNKLPSSAAMLQIDRDSIHSFITSEPNQERTKKRRYSIDKAIQTFKKDIYEYSYDYGHIRIRKMIDSKDDWQIEIDGTAKNLNMADGFSK